MSSGVTLTCLFFASVEAGSTLVINGMISSAIAAMCRPTASIWLLPKFSSFDQMSFTLIGLIPGGRGACFGGEKKSLSRPPNPPKFAPHDTASLLLTGLFEAGTGFKKFPGLAPHPPPKECSVKRGHLLSPPFKHHPTKQIPHVPPHHLL